MSLNKTIIFSSGKNVTITKAVLGIVMVLIISLALFFFFVDTSFFLITIIPLVIMLSLSIKLLIAIANYAVDEEGITINGYKVLWTNVYDINMYFQSRRIIPIKYKKNNKILSAILITTIRGDEETFIPREFKSGYKTGLEIFIRDKINK